MNTLKIVRRLDEKSKYGHSLYECECACGAIRIVASSDLSKTKGCLDCSRVGNRGNKPLVKIGDRFGFLEIKGRERGIYWNCECLACGKRGVLKSSESLRKNRSYNLHCGCLGGTKQYPHTPKNPPKEVWDMVAKYRYLLNEFENRNYEYDLALEYLIRASWVFYCRKGEGISDKKAYIFSWFRRVKFIAKGFERGYNNQININIGCDMTTQDQDLNISNELVGDKPETLAGTFDLGVCNIQSKKRIKFKRR